MIAGRGGETNLLGSAPTEKADHWNNSRPVSAGRIFCRLAALLLFWLASAAPLVPGTAYSSERDRSQAGRTVMSAQCLVRLDIRHDDLKNGPKNISNINLSFRRYLTVDHPSTPDISLAWVNFELVYLRFGGQCEQRQDIARRIARAHMVAHPGEARISSKKVKKTPEKYSLEQRFFEIRRRFRRADCIVRIDVEISDDFDVTSGGESLGRFITKYAIDHYPDIAGFSFHWQGRNRLYLQFIDECDRRLGMSKEMVSAYGKKYPRRVIMTVSEKMISPGPKTINYNGLYWIDGAP